MIISFYDYGIDFSVFGIDGGVYGIDFVIFGIDGGVYGIDFAIFGIDGGVYGIDFAIFGIDGGVRQSRSATTDIVASGFNPMFVKTKGH